MTKFLILMHSIFFSLPFLTSFLGLTCCLIMNLLIHNFESNGLWYHLKHQLRVCDLKISYRLSDAREPARLFLDVGHDAIRPLASVRTHKGCGRLYSLTVNIFPTTVSGHFDAGSFANSSIDSSREILAPLVVVHRRVIRPFPSVRPCRQTDPNIVFRN